MEDKIKIVDKLMNMKRYEDAIEYLNNIRYSLENDIEYYYKLSKIYEELGFYDEAIEKLERILDIDNNSGETYFKIANVYQKANELDSCYVYLNKALKYGFDSSKIFFYRGLIQEVKGNYEEALSFYNKSNIKNKSYMDPRYRTYYIYRLLGDEILIEKSLREIIENSREQYKGYRLLFEFLISKNRYRDGKNLLEEAKKIFFDSEELKYDLVRIYIKITKYEMAEEIIKSIPEDSDNYKVFQIEQSRLEAIYKNYYIARSILEKENVYDEKNTEILYLLGIYNIKIKDFKNSCKYLDKLILLDSNNLLVIVGHYLNACSYRIIEGKEASIRRFKKLYKFYSNKLLENRGDTKLIILKILSLLEIDDYIEINNIINEIKEENSEDSYKIIRLVNKFIESKANGKFNSIDIIMMLKVLWSR
ncbi:tetratricopeptide repeat protein [Clostridium massiliamazoniense]|uniref:tetratricopeptide repeat protein n=1 Tax=Clostridium massiliamazoniense TaxID=1347366 RepID=UPI0006D7A472|nr:tetratricopeptide repeat protein [Clostridium massiliamazoniense]